MNIMDNSQIENTINEIRKRSGAVTAFMVILFLISSSMAPTFVYAAEDTSLDEDTSLMKLIYDDFSHFKLYHVIEGIAIAFFIPFIYLKMQKISKKRTLVKIWKSNIEKINSIPKNSVNGVDSILENISFELNKIENEVAEVFSMVDYLSYASKMSYLKQLLAGTQNKIPAMNWLKNELNKLVGAN
jgi:hypothetical protein